MEIIGVIRGYNGLVVGDFISLSSSSVSNILHKGGTILKTARSKSFLSLRGRKMAYDNLINNNIDALIAIGGDGTFNGAKVFSSEFDFPGAPSRR